jgi:hypothetical protein
MISLSVIVHNVSLTARRKERSPKRMSFDKHSSFADLTRRSEYAFKFGLRAGVAASSRAPTRVPSRQQDCRFRPIVLDTIYYDLTGSLINRSHRALEHVA